ncbi:MAG TPA: hypothetical protein VG778_10065 [Blastocatellia bacterium]|jgi:hypothetical protein|nr:hypothetical protein [Blastocatellia bacterium]
MRCAVAFQDEGLQMTESELEHRVVEQAELAKRALREYREAIRCESPRVQMRERAIKKRVENAVALYLQSLKELNGLRSHRDASDLK